MHIFAKLSLLSTGLVVASSSFIAVAAALPATASKVAADTATMQSTGKPTNPGSQAGGRLAAAQLKVCQKRETAINNILTRISDRGQKQLDLFTTIATRVETFYTDKGKTLSNYDALVADVTAKQAAAQTEVDSVKADTVSFKCDGTDPKGAITSFKDALKGEIAALQAYRTSVRNLIVGVKSVDSTTATTSTDSTPSSPTTTTNTTQGAKQ